MLDRQPGPGMETSFANAGELSYGMTSPWAAPGIPMKAVKWLFMRHRPLFIWPMVDPAMWAWGVKMLANCNEAAYRLNKGRMVRISNYSRDALTDLLAEVPLEFDLREKGTLQLFRTEKQLKGSKADQEVLAEYDSPYEVLTRDECIAVEPGLVHVAEKFVGGLRLTADRTGDCRMFTLALADKAAEMGVSFRYGNTISGFTHAGRPDHLGRDRARAGDGGRLCLRARALCADPAPGGGDQAADLSDQGLFDHAAGHRRRGGAAVDADGRDAQGGDHPARRPDPGGRAGGDHRLQRQARADGDRHGALCGERPLPQGGRRQPGRGVDGPEADDAGRDAGDRADALCEPLPQHRARDAGVDHGLRLGTRGGRRGARARRRRFPSTA